MGGTLSAHPKSRYIVPSVLMIAVSVIVYIVLYSTISFQLSAYTDNKSRVVEEWAREGVDKSNVDKTIGVLNILHVIINVLLPTSILGVGFVVAVTMFAENITFTEHIISHGKYKVIDVLEYLLLAWFGYWGVLECVWSPVKSRVLFIPLAALAMGLFFYFTARKIRRQEQMLYGVFVLEILTAATVYFCYDPLSHNNNPGTRLSEHRDIKQGLKDRIVGLAARYGVGPDSIFVDRSTWRTNVCFWRINTGRRNGLDFKTVTLTSNEITSATDDQLMALLSHRLCHVANRDGLNAYRLSFASTVAKRLCDVGLYRMLAAHCNGLMALNAMLSFNVLASFLATCLYNYHVGHGTEFRADREAFKNGYAKHQIEFLKMRSTTGGKDKHYVHKHKYAYNHKDSDGGMFFDYTRYFGMYSACPSTLQRIKGLRRLVQQA